MRENFWRGEFFPSGLLRSLIDQRRPEPLREAGGLGRALTRHSVVSPQ